MARMQAPPRPVKKLRLTTENEWLSIFPNYLFGVVLTSRLKGSLGISYPPMFCEYAGSSNRWANDMEVANRNAEAVLNRIIDDENFAPRIMQKYDDIEGKMLALCRKLEGQEPGRGRKELARDFELFVKLYLDVLTYSWLPMASEGFEGKFSQLLTDFIKKKVSGQEKVNEHFVILSTPLRKTRRQAAEEEMERFIQQNGSKIWFRKFLDGNFDSLDKELERFAASHIAKYGWLAFDYEGPAMDENDVLRQIREIATKAGKSIESRDIGAEQESMEAELSLGKDSTYARLFRTIRDFMFLKNRSQETLFHSHYCLEKLLLGIPSRAGFSLKELRSMTAEEIKDTILGHPPPGGVISGRSEHAVFFFQEGRFEIITGEEDIQDFLAKNLEKQDIRSQKSIRGQTACSGYAEGTVRIVRSPDDMEKVQKGDILVSPKTSPNLLPVMRMAGAIVTDYGGITCHAAILSREMNIPCIIGTVNATKLLKDGDYVKVDARKGVVTVGKK